VNSKAVRILGNYTPEKLRSLHSSLQKYAPATLNKHHWVITMYAEYCTYLEAEAWPIQPEICANFLTFLRQEVKLAYSSITSIVVPGLKRVNKEKTGKIFCFYNITSIYQLIRS
jgi:hypothetical protein